MPGSHGARQCVISPMPRSIRESAHAHRCCGCRPHGRGHCGAADRGWARGDRLEPHGGQDQAAGGSRRQGRRHARPSSRARSRPSSPSSPTSEALAAVYEGPSGPACRRRQGQARHRDEHGAAARRGGAGREGARQGRRLRRMPGRRHGRAGAPGQAARLRRRQPRRTSRRPSRCSTRCAGASSSWGRWVRAPA